MSWAALGVPGDAYGGPFLGNPNLSFSEAELAWCSINKNVRIFDIYTDFGAKYCMCTVLADLVRWDMRRREKLVYDIL